MTPGILAQRFAEKLADAIKQRRDQLDSGPLPDWETCQRVRGELRGLRLSEVLMQEAIKELGDVPRDSRPVHAGGEGRG